MLGHISTFGGNPVACAAALAVLTEVNDSTILDHVEAKGALLESHLQHPKIREIRRKGLMLAIDLASEEMVESLIFKALDRGLILFWFLSQAQSFRIAPPLNIDDQDLIESAEIIKEILDEIV